MVKHSKNFFLYLLILASGFSTMSLLARAEGANSGMQASSIKRLPSESNKLKEKVVDDSLPANFPKRFDVIGVVYEINRAKGYMDVLARHYPLSPTVRYYKLNSNLNSLNDIKKDSIVGLILDSKKRVSEIYEVPPSMYEPS